MKSGDIDYDRREKVFNIMLAIGVITFIIMMMGVLMI